MKVGDERKLKLMQNNQGQDIDPHMYDDIEDLSELLDFEMNGVNVRDLFQAEIEKNKQREVKIASPKKIVAMNTIVKNVKELIGGNGFPYEIKFKSNIVFSSDISIIITIACLDTSFNTHRLFVEAIENANSFGMMVLETNQIEISFTINDFFLPI